MYSIYNYQTGELIETVENPTWVKMQSNGMSILCDTYEEADGVVVNNGEQELGIEGRNMQEYTPTVKAEKTPESIVQISFMSGAMTELVAQVDTINNKVNTLYSAQTEGTVLKSDLNAAYKEGVNTI